MGLKRGIFMSDKPVVPSPFIRAPHPEQSLLPDPKQYDFFLKKGWVAQAKMNGHRLQVCLFPDGTMQFFTRQGTPHTKPVSESIKEKLLRHYQPKTGLTVIEGEWVNPFKDQKFYLFDILKIEGKELRDLTYEARYNVLCERGLFIYPDFKILPILRAVEQCLKTMEDPDVAIEGLVFKSPYAGFGDGNIIRCRKKK